MMAQNQNALDFDGTNDYVETDFAGISGTGSRTVEAWIKTPYFSYTASNNGLGVDDYWAAIHIQHDCRQTSLRNWRAKELQDQQRSRIIIGIM